MGKDFLYTLVKKMTHFLTQTLLCIISHNLKGNLNCNLQPILLILCISELIGKNRKN